MMNATKALIIGSAIIPVMVCTQKLGSANLISEACQEAHVDVNIGDGDGAPA